MDTKWKNIKEKCMKMIETVRENRHGIIGGIYMAAGAVILIAMFGSFQRMYTRDILLVGTSAFRINFNTERLHALSSIEFESAW